jgi:predicted transcriptional regulator of viral defense system
MERELAYNYLEGYLAKVQSQGRYAVSLEELKGAFNISDKALLQNVFRLKAKGLLAPVRKEFYVIIPPRYMHRGMIPPSLFVDDMMKFLGRQYYVGLFSAAALHGAGHQQPMEFQVITQKPPLRGIKTERLNIRFFTKGEWEQNLIAEKKTETGYIQISSPELTAFDLVHYHKSIGGLNRILPILEELADGIKPSLLARAAKTQKIPIIQRLGFLFDQLGEHLLSESLHQVIRNSPFQQIPLSLAHKGRSGVANEQWGIIINTELDV